jgi:hypothetical protein
MKIYKRTIRQIEFKNMKKTNVNYVLKPIQHIIITNMEVLRKSLFPQ